MKKARPKIIKGDFKIDQRGKVTFVNNFTFKSIKRFYQLENSPKNPIRAFHGHMIEEKYVFVSFGSILLVLIPLNDAKKPSKNVKIYKYKLSSKKPRIIYIPPKYANGFKALAENAKVIFFSTRSLKESKKDDYRFAPDYWGKDIWKT